MILVYPNIYYIVVVAVFADFATHCTVRLITYHLSFIGFCTSDIGVVISPWPDLLPGVFCLMVRIFRLMLVLLYISSTNIPPNVTINRIYKTQNLP